MEPTSDSRFDPNYAVQMLLDAAHELSLEKVLQKFVARAVARPDLAFVQVWMLEKTDGCLHLAVAGGSAPPQQSESSNPIPLQSYDWPGNIRELRNVIERAVILARGGSLDFDLPLQTPASASPAWDSRFDAVTGGVEEPEFLTEAELQIRERDNLLRILTKTNWKIKGPDGAAELLGVKPIGLTTPSSQEPSEPAELPFGRSLPSRL